MCVRGIFRGRGELTLTVCTSRGQVACVWHQVTRSVIKQTVCDFKNQHWKKKQQQKTIKENADLVLQAKKKKKKKHEPTYKRGINKMCYFYTNSTKQRQTAEMFVSLWIWSARERERGEDGEEWSPSLPPSLSSVAGISIHKKTYGGVTMATLQEAEAGAGWGW